MSQESFSLSNYGCTTKRVIYMHTARVGRTRADLENEERVCFSVYEMGRLLPAKATFDFSLEYASVVVFGTATRINDQKQAADALTSQCHFHLFRIGKPHIPICKA
ncbi:hypothetical protein KSF_098810 [Reticulibacter mediterranei]|uniref:Uncharacterized protein n=1 Tax=Reticulibacter mediterranei TaxID=2778369 RepID=A0A8J3N8M0_9CHLR|nr:pyridoxamine 5'-phosphate oxidase family protein [Reticulibacter mediterranei]GHO99833.1 hypothetical protein KSF_098810 [Reticulibacter mediterranei]